METFSGKPGRFRDTNVKSVDLLLLSSDCMVKTRKIVINRKLPSGKNFKIYGKLTDGKKILQIIRTYFKEEDLPIDIELRQDQIDTIDLKNIGGNTRGIFFKNGRLKTAQIILNDKDDLTIIHELEHIYRAAKYGINDCRVYNEELIHSAAQKRLGLKPPYESYTERLDGRVLVQNKRKRN